MSEISLTREGTTDVVVPSGFLSEYMTAASGEYVKVYLYILHCFQNCRPFSTSSMADVFETSEKDILRAIKYWESKEVISCEKDGKVITGIRLLAPWEVKAQAEKEDTESIPKEAAGTSVASFRDEPGNPALIQADSSTIADYTLTPQQIKEIEVCKDFENLCRLVEIHFKLKSLNTIDYEKVMWIFYKLNKNSDACEILVEYCVEHPAKGRKMRQLEQLCVECLEKDLSDPKSIKLYLAHSWHCRLVKEALGVSKKILAVTEEAFVRKWFEVLKMDEELVKEACARAVRNTENGRFEYTDKILSNWHDSKITTMKEVAAADEAFKKSRFRPGGKEKASGGDKFVNFDQRDIDFSEQEAMIFGFKSDTASSLNE